MIRLDFTSPETLRKLAALPYYGYAEALVRRVDPYWHAPEPPYTFNVRLGRGNTECPHCGCDCGRFLGGESKTVEIEARDADEAEEIARAGNPSWFVDHVDSPKFPTVSVPDKYLQQFRVKA